VRRRGKTGRSLVLLTQHPRPSRFSGHDWRYAKMKMKKAKETAHD